MIKSSFSEWTKAKIEKVFEIKRVWEHPMLKHWQESAKQVELSDFETASLQYLRTHLITRIDAWNEQETREQFIGPLLTLADFNTDSFNLFSEREIKGIIGDYDLSGKPDGIIASGIYEPEIPYFCFHVERIGEIPIFLGEYKREIDPKGDPAGQCLIAMLVAQHLNKETDKPYTKPLYGAYSIGRFWFFIVLYKKEYAISLGYDPTHEAEIVNLFRILKQLKVLILE